LLEVDGGVDVTGHGFVSTTPGAASYGFQQFTELHSPGYFNADGTGHYAQTIDTTGLSDGTHYLTVRVFRHRSDGGPAVWTDFRQAFIVDHHGPSAQIVSLVPIVAGVNENQRLTVQTDLTANSVYVLLDLPAGLTDAQVLALLNGGNQANQIDRNLDTIDFRGLTNANHVFTVVAYKQTGDHSILRFPGFYTSTIFGAGLGDLNFDGQIDANDVNLFAQVLASNNSQFNPAADMNGDGVIDNSDLLLYYNILQNVGDPNALAAYNQLLGPPAAGFTINVGDTLNLASNQPATTSPVLSFNWDMNGAGTFDISGAAATLTWDQLANYGITDVGSYPITLQVTDGVNTIDLFTTLTVSGGMAPGGSAGGGRRGLEVLLPGEDAAIPGDVVRLTRGAAGFGTGAQQMLVPGQPDTGGAQQVNQALTAGDVVFGRGAQMDLGHGAESADLVTLAAEAAHRADPLFERSLTGLDQLEGSRVPWLDV
jgi:hypothetical protein